MIDYFGITGLRVLITGGTGGIGAALVGGFLDAGAEVCVLGRSTEALETLSLKHSAHTKRLHTICGDLLEDESIDSSIFQLI